MWERLHHLWQKLRTEEQSWQMLFHLGINTLRRSFEVRFLVSRTSYTVKNATNLLASCQFYQVATSLVKSGLLQLVACKVITTCHLQSHYNLLKQLVASLWITINSSTNCRKPCELILILACCNQGRRGGGATCPGPPTY